jgi:hypothetical protein
VLKHQGTRHVKIPKTIIWVFIRTAKASFSTKAEEIVFQIMNG